MGGGAVSDGAAATIVVEQPHTSQQLHQVFHVDF
jgi:hypothetical protein